MGRKNSNTRSRKHDTRLTFKQLAKLAGLDVKQTIVMARYIKEREHIK